MKQARLGVVARMYAEDLKEANETIRELRFKIRCYGELVQFALANLPEDARSAMGNGLFRLALRHIRGEHPLRWSFGDKTIRVE